MTARPETEVLNAERAVIGAILRGAQVEGLESRSFVDPVHQGIYRAIERAEDPGNLSEVLAHLPAGVPFQSVRELYDDGALSLLEHYLPIVAEEAERRDALGVLRSTADEIAGGGDPGAALDLMRAALSDLGARGYQTRSAATEAQAIVDSLDGAVEPGIRTIRDLDEYLDGLHKGRVYILAARPRIGKTAIAVDMAVRTAKAGKRVLFISLEMDAKEITGRILRNLTGTTIRPDARKDLELAVETLASMGPIEIRDSMDGTAGSLAGEIRRCRPDLVIIDYVQLLTGRRSEKRQDEVAGISRTIKRLSRMYKVPILALSQLNRAVEGRKSQRPQLSDLRESGALEQDADAVILLHRDADGGSEVMELIVGKNRQGPQGSAKVYFSPKLSRVEALSWANRFSG